MAAAKHRHRKSYAVWEITLKCNLACNHCGSRAGEARSNELSTAEALDLVHQMADAGIDEVTLIGGEAYLRKDWLQIAGEIVRCGMICTLTTGGYGISAELARRMKEAGLTSVSVSVDGMQATHDLQRGKPDSWKYAFESLHHLHDAGLVITANSQVNRLSAAEFPLLYQKLLETGAVAWQIAMTVPMGNAADNSGLLLQPSELLVFHPVLAYLAKRGHAEGLNIQPGNNFGYYGPYEKLLRGHGSDNEWAFWRGCGAGLASIGIEADGTIKGCPSLPTTAYRGGNIRERSLVDIAVNTEELTFNLSAGTEEGTAHLWGFCKQCEYAELCRGGCNWTAHVFFDKRGNNPYCHHRALVQAANGQREDVRIKRNAFGLPFDNGEFEILERDFGAAWPFDESQRLTADKIRWPQAWLEQEPELASYVEAEVERNIANMQRYLAAVKAEAVAID
ncbi:MAG: radical SAM protein [Thiolinea sp.]